MILYSFIPDGRDPKWGNINIYTYIIIKRFYLKTLFVNHI